MRIAAGKYEQKYRAEVGEGSADTELTIGAEGGVVRLTTEALPMTSRCLPNAGWDHGWTGPRGGTRKAQHKTHVLW